MRNPFKRYTPLEEEFRRDEIYKKREKRKLAKILNGRNNLGIKFYYGAL